MVDVEAAFLDGTINVPVFMEWLPGSVHLGYVTEENKKKQCIRLLGSIYSNVDAALIFYNTYAHFLISEVGMTRSMTDGCVFFLKDIKGQIVLIASCHVDDTQIAGNLEWNAHFKAKVKQQFTIKELGRIKKHLGIRYDWVKEELEMQIQASMDDLADKIVEIVKNRKGGPVRMRNIPAKPKGLTKNTAGKVNQKLY